jgi:hypothetical protein
MASHPEMANATDFLGIGFKDGEVIGGRKAPVMSEIEC